ncbi:MAG: type II toxin-antitoxin system VapB family antitoxin [Imperialibacter sp.]|uniref:type II toxin-antitoxin system VapB family antitoxin n=1 Tax=Imperialibacter sp. TaxID=2038411 RepID=UPI0032EF33A9
MRTTLDLPDGLIDKAMKISGAKTKSQLVTEALEEMINRNQRLKLISFKGKIDLDIDLDRLRERE